MLSNSGYAYSQIKVLIGDSSVEDGLNWANEIKKSGMYVITRPCNENEILNTIGNDMPDFLILKEEINASELMEKIIENYGKTPLTIIVSNVNSSYLKWEALQSGASYFMVKPFEPNLLLKKIISIYNFKFGNVACAPASRIKSIEYAVTDIIHQVGIPANLNGYNYLRTAIILAVNNSDILNSMSKQLYPTVAEKCSSTPIRVERSIRHAIEVAWSRGDLQTIRSIFGSTVKSSTGKPTNAEFVSLIADKVRLEFFPQVEF